MMDVKKRRKSRKLRISHKIRKNLHSRKILLTQVSREEEIAAVQAVMVAVLVLRFSEKTERLSFFPKIGKAQLLP